MYIFDPVFKSVLWGGTRIAAFKGLPHQGRNIGESWEISPMKGRESVVASGPDKGITLPALIAAKGQSVMGPRLMQRYSGQFPLLIKFIDSADDLSIQVHPDSALAARRHSCPGKTEMWYSIDPLPGAALYSGFSRPLDRNAFLECAGTPAVVDAMRRFESRPGDVFFLPAGHVHALGRGNFVLEIQQASDITYRIYDYGRLDADGRARMLHVDLAADAVDYSENLCVNRSNVSPVPNSLVPMKHCEHFNTDLLAVDGSMRLSLADRDSFSVFVCVDGTVSLRTEGSSLSLARGACVLVSHAEKSLVLKGRALLVSVYVP